MQIDHIQLAMPKGDEEKARAFYSGILGMNEEAKPPILEKQGGCWFSWDSLHIHLGVDAEFSPQKKAHPGFLVSDLMGLSGMLNDNGYPIDWDDSLEGRKRFYTTDCFGNRLEFLKDGDGFSQRQEMEQVSQ